MNTLLKLFGRSPFSPLETHMEEVARCVYLLKDLFKALEIQDYKGVEKIAKKISKQEHQADLTKNDLRNHLPKRIFLPIARENLLEILTIQDSIADRAEDVAVLCTLKKIELIDSFKEEFKEFLDKNIETFEGAKKIVKELHELLETTFGGVEAEKVRQMVHRVALCEHETDLIQRKMLRSLLNSEDQMSYTTFYVWQKILEQLGAIADLSENIAYQVRLTLELK